MEQSRLIRPAVTGKKILHRVYSHGSFTDGLDQKTISTLQAMGLIQYKKMRETAKYLLMEYVRWGEDLDTYHSQR